MKKQIVVIHGGGTFDSYEKYVQFLESTELDYERYLSDKSDWKPALRKIFSDKAEVVLPVMPSKLNARYSEWKIWFDKIIPHLRDGVILIGHSLGGIFLVRYLQENLIPVSVSALMLVAAPYNHETKEESLGDFKFTSDPQSLITPCKEVFIYHSGDDVVVPFEESKKYSKIFPQAKIRILQNKGHINQESFPELVDDLKTLI